MRYLAVLFLILACSLTVFTQPPGDSGTKKAKPAAKKILDEKEEWEKAVNEPDAAARIAALQKFIETFPESAELVRAKELIVIACAQLGEESLTAGNTASGIEFFKSAVANAPTPMSEKLFTEIIMPFPTNLFFRGQREAAFEVAKMIEEKVGNDPKQFLGLATFYIGIENASNARRLASKAIELAPEMPAAYHTFGIANRLGFRLDEAVEAFTKALELDPGSIVSKRSLAEMKRANGKPDEAITIYREILEKDSTDLNAKTGLVLALFESGKSAEAETEFDKLILENVNNLPLLVGAAYWYAAHNDGAKAVELAQKALAIEPRYTWANIALARGLLAQNRPLDAERILLTARNYGNFPTIDYEIASARLQAGFYREAAEELKKNFDVKNGVLETYLGNRVGVEAEDFLKLLSLERRAAIFTFDAADTQENADRLKSLLEFSKQLSSETTDETALSEAADRFIKGDDKMKIHRQLFVAGRLLDKKKDLPKVIELTQASIRGVDTALDVPNPSAAVMADELYETRTLALSRGEVLVIPEVPRRTLSIILRGRIEELSGWTLYQLDKSAEAVVRLKRAVSVLPEDSSMWRSSMWRLGAALEADGKSSEALENYIKSYKSGEANPEKYLVIETLYQKVNGNSEGLEEKIGKRPESISDAVAKVTANISPEPENSPSPETVAETSPSPPAEEAKQEEPQLEVTEEISPTNPSSETPNQENSPQAEVEATPTPEALPLPEPVPTPEITPETTPAPETATESSPTPETISTPEETVENSSEISPTPTPEITPSPTPEEIQIVETANTKTAEPITEIPTETIAKTVSENPAPEKTPTSVKPKTAPTSSPEVKSLTKEISAVKNKDTTPKPAETPAENNQSQTSGEKPKNTQPGTKAEASTKSLFEPIIIDVRRKENQKPKTTEGESKTEKPNSIEPNTEPAKPPKPAEAVKNEPKMIDAISTRPRVVIEDKFKTEEMPKCELVASQESVWLLNGGGSLGVMVGFVGSGDAKKITAVSSSPADIQIALEPEIGTNSGRAFFILKSISAKKGAFTVTFDSPCGKKEIQVRVR